jgi:hypothetical protein
LYREPDVVVRSIRDYLLADIDEVIIDDAVEYEEACRFFDASMPKQKQLLKLYQETRPLFSAYDIDDEIARTWQRTVRLPSGGAIVIDPTEALVAIDVNSAQATKEKDHEETAFKTNLEAADEIARQLRLRDLGGIVIIDFIDHEVRKHDREVERRLKDALKADKARTAIGRISRNGVLEMTRQRLRQAHSVSGTESCPTCAGAGVVHTIAARGHDVVRELRSRCTARNDLQTLTVYVDVDTANQLHNAMRQALAQIEATTGVDVRVLAKQSYTIGQLRYEETRGPKRQVLKPAPVSKATVIQENVNQSAGDVEDIDDIEDIEDIDDVEDIENVVRVDDKEIMQTAEPSKRKRRRRRKNTSKTDAGSAAPHEAADKYSPSQTPISTYISPATMLQHGVDDAEERSAGGQSFDTGPEAQATVAESRTDKVDDNLPRPLDELSEALFGAGPQPASGFVSLFEEAEQEPESESPAKRKRRRRKRKRKAEGDEASAFEPDNDPQVDTQTENDSDESQQTTP